MRAASSLVPCLLAASLAATSPPSGEDGSGPRNGSRDVIRLGPFELSAHDAVGNLRQLHESIQAIYYAQFTTLSHSAFSATWEEVLRALHELVRVAQGNTALLFPVGVELYHWFFFRWRDGRGVAEMDDESLELSADLLQASLAADSDCHGVVADAGALGQFLGKGCDYRWTHLIMVEAELGRELAHRRADVARAARILGRSAKHFDAMMRLPYFAGRGWASPYDMNYNAELYAAMGPVWPRDAVPLLAWLEEHFEAFRGDLDAIRAVPGLFDALHQLERNAEGQDHAGEEDWTVVELADTREEEPWKQRICAYAGRSCELLRARPELQCDHAAAYFNRMRPGAWIKPHMGNPPRLVAHLGLDVPLDPITLYVGPAQLAWQTGRAHAIDDTYVHSVRHHGLAGMGPERYILHLLLCHPCEPAQRHLYAGNAALRCE